MKKVLIASLLASFSIANATGHEAKALPNTPSSAMTGTPGASTAPIKVDEKEIGYMMGYRMGEAMKAQGANFDITAFNEGITDAKTGKKSKFDDQKMMQSMMEYRQYLMAKQVEVRKQQAVENKTAGEKFFAENKSKPGIVELPSGLQYKVIEAGNGSSPKATDQVSVEYSGRLLNGDVFSSTETTGKPMTIGVNSSIKAWQEVLPLMKTGAKWEIYVPAKLAYGEQGAGGKIGPEASLIFQVKLVDIVKPKSDAKSTDGKTSALTSESKPKAE
jgi:FKBP-type peptidyl-prolyl cis-trans isomerase FklB